MTEEYYKEKVAEVLRNIPVEFHDSLKKIAWDWGHAYGYQEVYGVLLDLVDDLKEPINQFRQRCVKSCAGRVDII